MRHAGSARGGPALQGGAAVEEMRCPLRLSCTHPSQRRRLHARAAPLLLLAKPCSARASRCLPGTCYPILTEHHTTVLPMRALCVRGLKLTRQGRPRGLHGAAGRAARKGSGRGSTSMLSTTPAVTRGMRRQARPCRWTTQRTCSSMGGVHVHTHIRPSLKGLLRRTAGMLFGTSQAQTHPHAASYPDC